MLTLKTPINLKDGTSIPAGAKVSIAWIDSNIRAEIAYNGRVARVRSMTAAKALAGKVPTTRSFEKWASDGVCPTPTGKRVEPDGIGSDGVPSWLMIAGLI